MAPFRVTPAGFVTEWPAFALLAIAGNLLGLRDVVEAIPASEVSPGERHEILDDIDALSAILVPAGTAVTRDTTELRTIVVPLDKTVGSLNMLGLLADRLAGTDLEGSVGIGSRHLAAALQQVWDEITGDGYAERQAELAKAASDSIFEWLLDHPTASRAETSQFVFATIRRFEAEAVSNCLHNFRQQRLTTGLRDGWEPHPWGGFTDAELVGLIGESFTSDIMETIGHLATLGANAVKYASRRTMVENLRLDPSAPSAQVVAPHSASASCHAPQSEVPLHPDLIDDEFLMHGHNRPHNCGHDV